MAVQNLGNYGGTPAAPAPSPRPVALQKGAVPAAVSPKTSPPPEQTSREQIQKTVEAMRKSLSETSSSNLKFSIDDETGQTIVRVTDMKTGELIRQIPSEELVELAKTLDRMQGKLLRQQA